MAVICRTCSGKLVYNPASQMLECVSCGGKYRPEDVEDANAELHSKYYDTNVYICPQCGAEVITSDTEVSTFCVYCGNPAVVFDRIAKEYRPDGIVPFTVTREEAVKNINAKLRKNPIVPKEVKAKCTPGNLRGIYVPYWVVNAEFQEADYLQGSVKKGKHSYTYYYTRAGRVLFRNLPIDGSDILNDDVSSRLEPFFFSEAREFDEDYLNGFYSNTSDISFFDLRASAANRCHKLYEPEVIKSVEKDKADRVKLLDYIYHVDIKDDPVYMMMPVWFLTFRHDGKPHTILVNGQTGKVVGTMPWQQKRIWTVAIAIFLLCMAVIGVALWGLLHGINGMSTLFFYSVTLVISFGGIVTASGFKGIKRILRNLRLSQSESIFKYVKRRQG